MDEQRSGRPTSITSQNVRVIKELLDKDRRTTVREVSQSVDCSVETVHTTIRIYYNMKPIDNMFNGLLAMVYISYQQVLTKDLLRVMQKKRAPQLSTMLFHHDNASSHRASTTQETIDRRSIEVLGHPPYSPDLAFVISSCFPH